MNDRERLDWLNEHKGPWTMFLLTNDGEDNGVRIACCRESYRPDDNEFKAPTIRKVIDMAMQAEEAEEQP